MITCQNKTCAKAPSVFINKAETMPAIERGMVAATADPIQCVALISPELTSPPKPELTGTAKLHAC